MVQGGEDLVGELASRSSQCLSRIWASGPAVRRTRPGGQLPMPPAEPVQALLFFLQLGHRQLLQRQLIVDLGVELGVPPERWTSKAGSLVGQLRGCSCGDYKKIIQAEYRVEAAHRVIDSGRTITEVARELGISDQLLGRWVRDERVRQAAAVGVPDVPDTPVTESERAELVGLRRKVVDQARQFEEQERDVTS